MLVSPLVGTRLHACSRQEAHLLTANNLQLVSKFSLILGQISTTEVLFKYWQRLLFDTLETRRRLGRVNFRKDFWDRYWVRAVPSNSPRSLCEVNSPQFPFRSKVANVQWPTTVTKYKRETRKSYLVVVSKSLTICVQKGIALTHPVTLILIYIIHNQWDLTFSFTATKIRPKPTSQSPTPLSYWQNGKEIKVENCNNSVNCKLHLICALFKKHAAYTNKRKLRRGLGFGFPNIWRIRKVTSSKKQEIMTVSGACYSPFVNRPLPTSRTP